VFYIEEIKIIKFNHPADLLVQFCFLDAGRQCVREWQEHSDETNQQTWSPKEPSTYSLWECTAQCWPVTCTIWESL